MKLTDVAQYYIGQKIKIGDIEQLYDFTGLKNKHTIYTGCNELGIPLYWKVSSCKPILRTLDSLTDEECKQICKLAGFEKSERLNVCFENGFYRQTIDLYDFKIIDHSYARDFESYYPLENAYQIFHYLLQFGIDLFGLIESGQAINSTTLNKEG